MKKLSLRKSFWQSLLSAFVFGVFVYVAFGSWEDNIKTKYLGNGIYEEIFTDVTFRLVQSTTGSVDDHKKWHGPIKIETYKGLEGDLVLTEEVNMIHGKRHGQSKMSWPDCYSCTDKFIAITWV